MSAGLSDVSDDDLLRMLNAPEPAPNARAPLTIKVRPSDAPTPGASDLSQLSDDDLLAQLGPAPKPSSFDELYRGDPAAPRQFSGQTASSSLPLARGLQAKADAKVIGAPSLANDVLAAVLGAGQGASLNVAGNVGAGIATALGAAGAPGYSPRSFSENYQKFQDIMGAHGRQSPKSSIAGTIGGSLATAPLLPVLGGAPAAALPARIGQYAFNGGVYGALAEGADSYDLGRFASGGAAGGAGGAVLGPAIEKLAPPVLATAQRALGPLLERFGVSSITRPSGGFTLEAQEALRAAGLDPAQIPSSLASELTRAFDTKGVSPAAIREAQAAEFGIPLSRGQATGDAGALRFEGMALSGSGGARAQSISTDFAERQGEAVFSARDFVNRVLAGDRTPITSPREAAESVADAARRIGDDTAFRAAAAQRGADQALETVRGHGLPADTLDAAALASQATRDAAGRAKAAYRQGYADVANIPGSFQPGALDMMGSRVRDRIGAELPIDDVLTPAASRAVADLDALPGIFGLQPGQGPDLRQVDQLRKRLVKYRQSTGANPTDRAAMDRILTEFDGHVHDAMDIGLFGQRAAPSPAPTAATDDFPGFAAASLPDPASATARAPETMAQFIARNGGLELSDDARAADLHRWQVGGVQRLARPGGRSIDELRDPLVVAGFLSPDSADGSIARNIQDEVMEALRAERAGRPRYRFADEARVEGGRKVTDATSDQNADFAAQLDLQARRIALDMEGYGLRRADLDDGALNDAAGIMLRREADDAASAYDMAVARRAEGRSGSPVGSAAADVPFDMGAAPAAREGFPAGDTSPADAMRRARGLFREYKQAFAPRGPGDTAGRNLQKIADRDATPNEVASMLFGGASGRVTGRQLETLDRMRSVVGADSDAWRAVQQAVMGRYLEGRDVPRSLDYLLRGEGRELANRVLTPQQRAGLDAFRTGTIQAENARASVPEWVSDLASGGYDPNRVLRDLFGSGIPGAKPGQTHYARGLRQYLGTDSVEWANLRQAAWLQLVQHDGAKLSPKKEAERIRAFLTGEGKGLAETMFSKDERALMDRYATAVRATDIPKGGRMPDGGRAAGLASHIINVLAGIAAFKVAGPGGAAGAYGAKIGNRVLQGGLNAGRASRSFSEGAPRLPKPPSILASRSGATGGAAAGLLGVGLVPSR